MNNSEEFKYFNKIIENIKNDMSEMNILRNIINPFSPYFLCNHFIGNEIHEYNVNIPDDKHDILKTNNLSLINNTHNLSA